MIVRTYPSPQLAEADQRLLVDENVPVYLKSLSWAEPVSALMVSEDHLERAIHLLGTKALPRLLTQKAEWPMKCPACQSGDIASLPPYAGAVLLSGLVTSVFFGINRGMNSSVQVLFCAAVLSSLIFWKVPRFRCRHCGFSR